MLLKAAMPMLATASAQLQGKTLVEVCTVYGVATVALDSQGTDLQASHSKTNHSAEHGGAHCGLSGLLAGGLDFGPTPPVFANTAVSNLSSECAPSDAHDACAAWVARLHHGPPGLS